MGITAKPTKMMMEWVNDQIAPAYWVPNAEIHACRTCTTFLSAPETKHHCRWNVGFNLLLKVHNLSLPSLLWFLLSFLY